MFVKICGITTPQDARVAVEAGADAIGFVFWPGSPRRIDVDRAREIGADLPAGVVRVGVFVDASGEELQRVAEAAHLDLLQLHGDEQPGTLPALCRPAWKALRVGSALTPHELRRWAGRVSGVLLDTQAAAVRGGSGQSFDWSLARGAREHVGFLMLAGGLNADNVRRAIELVQPDGVDVSSGIEVSPGRKDAAKVRAFVAAARATV